MIKKSIVKWFVLIALIVPFLNGCSLLKKLIDKQSSESSKETNSLDLSKNWGKEDSSNHTSGNILKSNNDLSEITLPEGWKEQKGLNEKADIQAADSLNNNFMIVLSESKLDFNEMTLDKHSEATRSILLKAIGNPVVEGPTRLTINGFPAVQYKITGSIDNLNPVYLHTTIETPKNFHQVLAWTLASKYEKNKPVLDKVIGSFKEVKP